MHSRSFVGEVDRLGHEVAVVEDVAVRQGRALGVAGRARRVLDVDGVVRLQGPHPLVHDVGVDLLAGRDHVVPVAGADVDHPLEARGVGRGLLDHRAVVAGLEALRGDQHPQPRVVDRVGELVGAVGRVDVDEDGADLRRGELGDRPLRTAGRPHADPVALREPPGDQAAGEQVDVVVELAIGPAPAAGELHQRLVVGVRRHGPVEVPADRLLEERRLGLTGGVGLHVCLLQLSSPTRTRPAWTRTSARRCSASGHYAGLTPGGRPPCCGPRTAPGRPRGGSSACRRRADGRRPGG